MAAPVPRKRLAADSNLIFDLAEDKDFAHTFREVFQSLGYAVEVPPTVVQELAFKAFYSRSGANDLVARRETDLAREGLRSLLSWGLRPFDLLPAGHGIAEQFAYALHHKQLLPPEEFNAGLILAECSLGGLPLLVTSDHHLLDIAPEPLRLCFESRDLTPVAVAHPKSLLRAVNTEK
jgi:PIN domain